MASENPGAKSLFPQMSGEHPEVPRVVGMGSKASTTAIVEIPHLL